MRKSVVFGLAAMSFLIIGTMGGLTMAAETETEYSDDLLPAEDYTGEVEGNITVSGRVYQFDNDNHYQFSEVENTEEAEFSVNTYGLFSMSGHMEEDGDTNGIPSFVVIDGEVSFYYTYGDALLNAKGEAWHLVNDNSKKVDTFKLDNEIKKGAVILQTSRDGKTWVDDIALTDTFKKIPRQNQPFYSTRGVQLVNGCYYRVIVAYKTGRTVGQNKILFVKTDQNEYRRYAEVYEFYLHDVSNEDYIDSSVRSKSLGTVTRTGTDNGFKGSKDFDLKDPHYGWELGNFFVSGFTSEKEKDGIPVFLKNVGDQITLWFNLKQDINHLNGKDSITIADNTGYDQYFQTPKMHFGRGTLIIRYTDNEGVKHDPEIYTNFLEANASTSADTIVKLFEEGDYEVALDYEIKNVPRKVAGIEVVPEYTDYRLFFQFKVRNANCMVFPFDIVTHEELTNKAITENGFSLDLARSRYLDIKVKKFDITEGVGGLTEDTRLNSTAKDGDEYTAPGLYIISVENLYTSETTTKEIFIGTDSLLNEYLAQGASLDALLDK